MALKSMTAFARSSLNISHGRLSLEIQSVNRKFLEINFQLPKEFAHFESDLRKWISEEVFFGQVQVTLKVHFEGEIPFKVVPNIALAKELYKAWKKIAKELGIKEDFDLKLLLEQGVVTLEEDPKHAEKYRKPLEKLTKACLKEFIQARKEEGKALRDDLSKRLRLLRTYLEEIASLAQDAPEKQRSKLLARIQQFIPDSKEGEERLIREIALIADKMDVQEEITRFASHCEQFKKLLAGSIEGVGKKMDFLLQEMGREVNTLGSKTQEIEVSKRVVEMKTELSRMREQVQNVE